MARERTLKVNIVGDAKSLNATLGHSTTRLSKLGKVAGVAGGAVGAGLGFAVKSAMGFEKQLSSLAAVSDATAKQMEQFRKQALKAGLDTAFSAKEAAVAQTELAKGGLSVANIMSGGLSSALALAAAGELELGEAASYTANAMNLFKLRGSESVKVADALATAANATTADVADFGEALKQGGAVAKSAGFSFEETVVALESLAASGVKGSDAGTSLKAALIQLIKPTAKQAKTAKDLGLSFIDAEGNMKSLGAISAMLRDKLGDQTAAQRTATLATLAGTDGVRTLTSLYDAGPKRIEKWNKGVRESGTAAEVAKKKQDNFAGAMEQLSGSAETLGITVGTALIPALTDATKWLTNFLNEVQTGTGTGGQFINIMRSVGGAIYDVGKFVVDSRREILALGVAFGTFKVLTAVVAGFRALRAGLLGAMVVSKLVPAFWALNAALTANPIGLVVVGLSALAGGLVYAYTKSKTFREVMSAAFSVVRKVAADAFDVITFGLRQYLVGIGKIAGAVSSVPGMGWLKGVSKAALGAAAKLKDVGDAIRGVPKKKTTTVDVEVKFKGLGALLDQPNSISKTMPTGDGLGTAIGKAAAARVPRSITMKGSAGSLMGAHRALSPIAAVGARFGLRVSSGLRPGAITSSGNASYHGSGEAVDLAGPPGAMLKTFRTLKSTVGSKLAELIYTPGGIGIRNGRPHRYTGAVAADHHDHVHAALDLGSPGVGIGDGYGRFGGPAGDGEGMSVVGAFKRAISKTKAPHKAALALFEAGIVESGLRNLNYGDRDSKGALQLRVGLHGEELAMDPYRSALAFLLRGFTGRGGAIALSSRLDTAGQVAQAVQGSAFPDRYDKVRARALTYLGKGGGGGASRSKIEAQLNRNQDRLDALRNQLGNVPRGKAGTRRRRALQAQIRGLVASNRNLRGDLRDAPTDAERREAQEREGSRLVNRIAAATLGGASRDIRAQRSIGQVIEDAEGGYGRSERFFGQVRGGRPGDFGEEDLGTAAGRADRISELQELKKLKANQLARMRKRAAALKRLIAKYEKALKRMHRARSKSRGAKRAKISERMKAYDDRLVDYKAELRGLGESIADTQLDIGDLTKDIQEVAATPDTEGPTASDKLSLALGDIDLQERAGLLTPEQAQAARIGTLNAALAGGFGALGQREIWDVMGQLREVTAAQVEAQKAATEAALAQTQALRDLKASIDAQVAFGDRVSAITSMEAVRAMADVMSRQLGTNVAARQSLPGSGQLSRL